MSLRGSLLLASMGSLMAEREILQSFRRSQFQPLLLNPEPITFPFTFDKSKPRTDADRIALDRAEEKRRRKAERKGIAA